jgi:CubicO group peptidase (beta-lactamase class C family)
MSSQLDPGRLLHAAAIADAATSDGSHPCVVLAVANSRETVWTHVSPGSDSATLDSIFLIASITKPVVATAVMRLVEEGKLLLNKPVVDYLPEFGANGKERVTLWHLLTHSSGLEEGRFYEEWWAIDPPPGDPMWLYEAACRSYLRWEPGTAHAYTTLSFSVMARLITVLGGEFYPDYLRRHIFEPLGMKDTGFRPSDPAREAPVHNLGANPIQREAWFATAEPGGGLWSTAADLTRFGQACLNGGRLDGYHLLSPATVVLMTQHYTEGKTQVENGRAVPFNYGLGWGKPSSPRDGDTLGSPRAYGHSGASNTLLWIDPEYDLVFVFLSNSWGAEAETRGRALNAVYGALGGTIDEGR